MNVWENVSTYHPKSVKKKKQDKKHRIKKVTKDYRKALRKNKRGLITNITIPEQAFKDFLDELEISYHFQRIVTVGTKGYIVDFYLTEYLMVVEIDGDNHKAQDEKDNKRTEGLLTLPYIKHVVRFDNDEILAMDIDDVRKILAIRICPFIEDLLF